MSHLSLPMYDTRRAEWAREEQRLRRERAALAARPPRRHALVNRARRWLVTRR